MYAQDHEPIVHWFSLPFSSPVHSKASCSRGRKMGHTCILIAAVALKIRLLRYARLLP